MIDEKLTTEFVSKFPQHHWYKIQKQTVNNYRKINLNIRVIKHTYSQNACLLI